MVVLPFVAGTALYVAGALLATGGRARRAVAASLGLAAIGMPYLLPKERLLLRAFASLLNVAATIRLADLVLTAAPISPLRRLAHAASIVDSFRLRKVAPSIAWRPLVKSVLFVPIWVGGLVVARDVAPRMALTDPALGLAARWLAGLAVCYAISDSVYGAVYVGYVAGGWAPPPIHRDPALSRSVREFWGRRWNRIIGAWLGARFFRPLARRGRPRLGMAAAFVASALLHVYVADLALGGVWALIVGAYFLVQGLLALVEGPLHVASWPAPLAHAWTIAVMALTSPPFVEAALRVAGIAW